MKKQTLKFFALALGVIGLVGMNTVPVYADNEDSGNSNFTWREAIKNPSEKDEGELDLSGLVEKIINYLLYGIGILSVIMIIFGGFRYATSGGDAGKVGQAKNTILYALIGLIVAVMAYAIVNFVVNQIIGPKS